MKLLPFVYSYLTSWGMSPGWAAMLDDVVAIVLILIIALLADVICRHFILRAVAHLVKKTKATWDDVMFDHKVMVRFSRMVIPVVFYLLLPLVYTDNNSPLLHFVLRVILACLLLTFFSFVDAVLKAAYVIYSDKEQFRNRPLKGLLQTLQVVLWFAGAIAVVAILVGKSPWALLTGLGASAAILMLVFKDSIMGFVSGVQLSANDMLKVGDWIKMPKYEADGVVTEVTLATVKVRNWDNTITTIPPYMLVSDSFQNWQAMRESGGRRIKRSINIDMTSVRFCTEEMLERYRRIDLLKPYLDRTEQELQQYNEEHGIDPTVPVNGRRQTNLGVFRAYLTAYLRSLPTVNQELHCMVRQLQPTDRGIPMELYFFSAIKDWVPYENVQSDVFDHVLAIIPEFDLRVFQSPSGYDMQEMRGKLNTETE